MKIKNVLPLLGLVLAAAPLVHSAIVIDFQGSGGRALA